jgi:hypothetical protein
MKRGVIVLALFLVLFVSLLFIVQGQLSVKVSQNIPNITSINCSNETIKQIWSAIFQISPTEPFTIHKNETNGRCISFVAFKNISTELYVLRSYVNSTQWDTISDYHIATYSNTTPDYIQTGIHNGMYLNEPWLPVIIYSSLMPSSNLSTANMDSFSKATDQYKKVYRKGPSSWTLTEDSSPDYNNNGSISFSFNFNLGEEFNLGAQYQFFEVDNKPAIQGHVMELEDKGFQSISETGSVSINYSFASYVLSRIRIIYSNVSSCTPIWVSKNTSCLDGEQTVYYQLANSCVNFSKNPLPANFTKGCDLNNINIAGNHSKFQSRNSGILIIINNSEINLSNQYNETQEVLLKESSQNRVKFNYNFSFQALDISQINITKQPSSSSFGYLIVNGLNISKIIYLDKINAGSNQVCVYNGHIENINNISSYCNSTNEVLLSCPGSSNNITCSIEENLIVIAGLSNSAAKEMIPNNTLSCVSNWTCLDWSSCVAGQQTRICLDVNNCNISDSDRTEQQPCQMPCSPNWKCSNWTQCSKEGNHSRVCTDQNSCGVLTGKPLEFGTCEKESSGLKIALFVFFGILILAIIVGVVMLTIYYLRKDKTQDYQNIQDLAKNQRKQEFI